MKKVKNTNTKFKKLWKIIGLPCILFLILLTFFIIWKLLKLPPEDQLVQIARSYFDKYGLITVFVSAIIEGLLLVGWYYPGSLVIFLGVIFAGKDIIGVAEVVLVVSAGLFIAYIINYFLGKYGWYKLFLAFGLKEPLDKTESKLSSHGSTAIFMSYWEPNLASLTSTAAGILQFPIKRFLIYSLLSLLVWDSFWGISIYFLGDMALSLIGFKFALIVMAIWILYLLVANYIKKHPKRF